jgi:pimeloyl-ACP methyl ester carboxylesterase
MNERAWPPETLTMLADAGFTPLALRYNSGRAIARNGAELAALLELLLAAWPLPVQRLVLVGHSMGGLVARSALHQATAQGLGWPARVSDLAFLGTPHHGAPLERLGHAATTLLAATPYAAPFARLARLRSAGITELRHGHLLEDPALTVPLPAGVRCHAVVGLLGAAGGAPGRHALGDGLVPLASALGRHADPARALHFEPAHTHVADGVGHLALLTDAGVRDRAAGVAGATAGCSGRSARHRLALGVGLSIAFRCCPRTAGLLKAPGAGFGPNPTRRYQRSSKRHASSPQASQAVSCTRAPACTSTWNRRSKVAA